MIAPANAESRTTLLEDAVDVPAWLEADQATPYAERARRDRAVGRTLDGGNPLGRVRAWWRAVPGGGRGGAGARLERLRALVCLVMVGLGAFAGVGLALAAFRYDGSQPVNVVRLLALVVGLQLALLAPTLLLLLPGRVPGVRGLQDLLAAINPGAVAASVVGRLTRSQPGLESLFDWHTRVGAGRFAKWQFLVWSQVAAVAFNLAALAIAIALVTFTDLAFGWSTTLAADPAFASRVVSALAWPWQAFAPEAVPSAELVEQSQFFRLDTTGSGGAARDSRALTGWWPFTVLAIVTYGLVPRLGLLAFALWQRRRATRALLLDDARVTALLDRMTAPAIETEAAEHDTPTADEAPSVALARPDIGGTAAALIWEGAVAADAAEALARRRFNLALTDVFEAGGGHALSADREELAHIAAAGPRTLLVFTPAWEPPVLELLDFLTELRSRLGPAASIVVVPLPEGAGEVSDVERATWRHAVDRLGDSRLYVETGAA